MVAIEDYVFHDVKQKLLTFHSNYIVIEHFPLVNELTRARELDHNSDRSGGLIMKPIA